MDILILITNLSSKSFIAHHDRLSMTNKTAL